METAMAWGYTLSEWMQESEYLRAKAMSHYLHSKMREGYSMEQSMKDSKSGSSSSSGGDGLGKIDSMMKAMKRGFNVSSPGVAFEKGSDQ